MSMLRESLLRVNKTFSVTLLMFVFIVPSSALSGAESHAVSFMYHRFGEDSYPSTNIRTGQFQAQIDFLAENSFTILSLPEVIQYLQKKVPLPDKTVTITVDDAWLSNYLLYTVQDRN